MAKSDISIIQDTIGIFSLSKDYTDEQCKKIADEIYKRAKKAAKLHYEGSNGISGKWTDQDFKRSGVYVNNQKKAAEKKINFDDWMAICFVNSLGKEIKDVKGLEKFFLKTVKDEVKRKKEIAKKQEEENANLAETFAERFQARQKEREANAEQEMSKAKRKQEKESIEESYIKGYEERHNISKSSDVSKMSDDQLKEAAKENGDELNKSKTKLKELAEEEKKLDSKQEKDAHNLAIAEAEEEVIEQLKKDESLKKMQSGLRKYREKLTKTGEKTKRKKKTKEKPVKENIEKKKEIVQKKDKETLRKEKAERRQAEIEAEIKRRREAGKKAFEKYKTYAEKHEEDVETQLEVTVSFKTYDELLDLRDGLQAAIEMDNFERRKQKVKDILELDETKVCVYNKTEDIIEIFPEYALKGLRKSKNFVRTEIDGIGVITLTEEELKKLKKAIDRPFDKYYLDRVLKGKDVKDSRAGKISDKEVKGGILGKINFEENYSNNDELSKAIEKGEVFEFVEDAKKYLRDLKSKETQQKHDREAEALRKERDLLMKKYYEARAKMIRLAQREHRDRLRAVEFTGAVNSGKPPAIEKVIAGAKIQGQIAAKNANAKIATIATDIDLYDSERIFAKSYNRIMDEYYRLGSTAADHIGDLTFDMKSLKDEEFFDKNGKYTEGNKWKRRVYSEKIEWNLAFDFKPIITSEEHYTVKSVLKPAVVKSTRAKVTVRDIELKKDVKKEVDFGCLFAATYFYTIVANTPIDENYEKKYKINQWYKPKIAIKLREKHSKLDKNKSWEQIERELNNMGTYVNRIRYKNYKHKSDLESVRGDWVMTFRGKTFKAFNSKPNKKSKPVAVDYYFTEEDFINPVTQGLGNPLTNNQIYETDKKGNKRIKNTAFKPFIWSLAEQIAEVAGASDDDFIPIVTNINPRWQILEYGLYTSEPNGPHEGKGKYGLPHGIKVSGFTYQAPMGFKRIADAQFNAILTRSAEYNKRKGKGDIGNASSYTRGNRSLFWNYNVTRLDRPEYEELLSELRQQDHTLYDLHSVDSTKVWTVKEL